MTDTKQKDYLVLDWEWCRGRAREIAREIEGSMVSARPIRIYAPPRGGYPALALVAGAMEAPMLMVGAPEAADFVVDDIIDSGRTIEKIQARRGRPIPCFALVDKRRDIDKVNAWVVFPWEHNEDGGTETIESNVHRLLQSIEPGTYQREGLSETPKRVAKAYQTWFGGYGVDPESVLKVFEDGADKVDEMVVVRDIPFYSHCEHHMAPFFGTATVAYIPDGKIVGLSKIARLVDSFARRLQVQERLTNQIAEALWTSLAPKGVGVILQARHLCIESRGVGKTSSSTVTSSLLGVFKQAETRAEFMQFAK